NYFDTERFEAETFYGEELKTIGWDKVDRYPIVGNCGETLATKDQKPCFETALAQHIAAYLANKPLETKQPLQSTATLYFEITRQGALSVQKSRVDSLTIHQLPNIEQWLAESVASLPVTAPAYKRGIPVNTQFTLPVKIKTAD
ncbi:MAG: hypothetical protein ACPG7E_06195, partial [Marinirhabdus sp.]